MSKPRSYRSSLFCASSVVIKILLGGMIAAAELPGGVAFADPTSQATAIFNRLNGVPPTKEYRDLMAAKISDGKLREAALMAIDHEDGNFYNIVLFNMVRPWTNENLNARVPLNDYIATAIGMTRDELDFRRILFDDLIYVGTSPDPQEPLPDYSTAGTEDRDNNGNAHYQEIEARGLKLHSVLVRKKQSELSTALPEQAGILTSWGFAKEFYNAGTNRSALRFSLSTFLCHDIEQLLDTTRPDFRVRQDVSREPGGDAATYKNRCAGCHSGMDALAGAFAYLNYTDADGMTYDPRIYQKSYLDSLTPDQLQMLVKYRRNANEFPGGFKTIDDTWQNLWAEGGPNTKLGWNGARKGRGVKSFGKMVSRADAFASCMAQRVLVTVCKVDPTSSDAKVAINQLANGFKANGQYNMKHLFARASLMCRGE